MTPYTVLPEPIPEDPPPKEPAQWTRRRSVRGRWAPAVHAATSNPGVWFKVGFCARRTTGEWTIPFRERGMETTQRVQADGLTALYVRLNPGGEK